MAPITRRGRLLLDLEAAQRLRTNRLRAMQRQQQWLRQVADGEKTQDEARAELRELHMQYPAHGYDRTLRALEELWEAEADLNEDQRIESVEREGTRLRFRRRQPVPIPEAGDGGFGGGDDDMEDTSWTKRWFITVSSRRTREWAAQYEAKKAVFEWWFEMCVITLFSEARQWIQPKVSYQYAEGQQAGEHRQQAGPTQPTLDDCLIGLDPIRTRIAIEYGPNKHFLHAHCLLEVDLRNEQCNVSIPLAKNPEFGTYRNRVLPVLTNANVRRAIVLNANEQLGVVAANYRQFRDYRYPNGETLANPFHSIRLRGEGGVFEMTHAANFGWFPVPVRPMPHRPLQTLLNYMSKTIPRDFDPAGLHQNNPRALRPRVQPEDLELQDEDERGAPGEWRFLGEVLPQAPE